MIIFVCRINLGIFIMQIVLYMCSYIIHLILCISLLEVCNQLNQKWNWSINRKIMKYISINYYYEQKKMWIFWINWYCIVLKEKRIFFKAFNKYFSESDVWQTLYNHIEIVAMERRRYSLVWIYLSQTTSNTIDKWKKSFDSISRRLIYASKIHLLKLLWYRFRIKLNGLRKPYLFPCWPEAVKSYILHLQDVQI